MEQLAIAFAGVIAIWFSQDCCPKRRRFACLFGLAGQPFWFYSAWQAEQWGIFCLCFFYAWAWFKGVRLHWHGRGQCGGESARSASVQV